MTAIAEVLQTPLFTSLSILEHSTLPLQSDHYLVTKVALYAMKFFEGVAAICLVAISLPIACFGIIFQILPSLIPKSPVGKPPPFPSDFKFGVADSFFQSCGLGMPPGASDWQTWTKSKYPDGKPHIEGKPDWSQMFVNFLDNPQLLITQLKKLGAKTYRFSLERCVLEPQEGKFDTNYIRKYRRLVEALKANGIMPMATLHHVVNPLWFAKKGGFEKQENIAGFVKYCDKMFDSFGDLITHWGTINEPAVYTLQGYIRGVYPPGKQDPALAAEVLKNILIAHCRVYESGKKHHPSLQIGITHQWLRFQPYRFYNLLEQLVCHYLSEITSNAVVRFFKTGHYSLKLPFVANVQHYDEKAPNDLDWIGVQYYTKPLLQIGPFSAGSTCEDGGTMMGQGGRFYPEGLEEVLEEAATLKKRIWVTEVGSDTKQAEFFRIVFSIMARAIAKGIQLVGALAWTLRDNLEWDRGDTLGFGLYKRNFKEKEAIAKVVRPVFQSRRIAA